jgi:tetratricopeptide (TPR) repeat protein
MTHVAHPEHEGARLFEPGSTTPNAIAPAPVAKHPDNAQPLLDQTAAATARGRRNKGVLGGLLAAVVLGGGIMLYQCHAAAQERTATINQQLDIARTSYAASDPLHWDRAAIAARHVIELDEQNPEALGIGAESLLASALGDGTAAPAKIRQARAMLDAAQRAGVSNPKIARARALAALAAHQPDGAITQLQPLVAQAPRDAVLALYLGWALAAKGDPTAAIESYDRAISDPAVKLTALVGRGNAKLDLTEHEGARADFSAALEIAQDHIGALVGRATAQPPSAAAQQEAELLEILARKDLSNADPRVVAQAWTRVARAAMRAGHGDVARKRFRKALDLVPQDLAATIGLAETELGDGKVSEAAALTKAVLNRAKDNVPALLVQSEIEIKQHNLPLAAQRLAALANHVTPLAQLQRARLHLLIGNLLEAQGKDNAALDAYIRGAEIARDLDPTPILAAVKILAAMITAALVAEDDVRAAALHARSEVLLGELAALAQRDALLALPLGSAYLQEGDTAKAEPWLQKAVAAQPRDPDARFQLGRALLGAGKTEEALEVLTAALDLDPARTDIGGELAHTHEVLGRDADAGALYADLLTSTRPSLELRTRAGRFFLRTGALDRAEEQGAKIAAADPKNAYGLYLQAEGRLAAGEPLEAKQLLQRALEIERTPSYLDALGRAAEALSRGSDRQLQELALESYQAAAAAVPPIFNSLAGQGRLYLARHEAEKAMPPLRDAAKLDPKNADVRFLLGAAYQELQQPTMALRWLEASIKLEPRAEAFWRIGQIYNDANQGSKAATALANATRLAADSEKQTGVPIAWLTDALYLQGRVNFDLHHDARAREAWLLYLAHNPLASAQLTEVQQLLATSLRP